MMKDTALNKNDIKTTILYVVFIFLFVIILAGTIFTIYDYSKKKNKIDHTHYIIVE